MGWSRRLRAGTAGTALLVLLAAGCGGQAARSGGGDDGTVVVTGRLSRRGSTPFSLMLLQASDGKTYLIQSTAVGDELRQLDGMEVAVSGRPVPNEENENVLAVFRYDLLRTPSGEKPVVGIVYISRGGDWTTDNPVWMVDDNQVQWNLRGDFSEVLRSFAGAKVWVTGVVQRSINVGRGSMRTILVTEYGVIRP